MASLPDTLNARWKEDKSRFGYKMLQKMGWSEDKGLGKNETGAVAAVKLKKREDGAGLGVEKMTDGAGAKGWSETATSFNSVLDTLKGVYGKDKKKRKKESEGESGSPLRISAGMKYKKHAQAKSLSNKSQEELRAVLGAAYNPASASASASASAEGTGEKKKRKSKEKSEKREKRERESKRRRSGTNSTSTDEEEPPHVSGKEKEKEASSSHRRSGSISTVGSASIKVSLARRRSNSTSSMGSLGCVASHDDNAAPKKAKAKAKLEEQQAETKSQKKDKLKKKDRGDK